MNTENLITAIEKFFFEIIGQLLPGLLFIAGLCLLLPLNITTEYAPTSTLYTWILIGVAYAIGGGLTAIGSYFFVPTYIWLINNSCILKKLLPEKVKDVMKSNDEIDTSLQKHQGVKYLNLKYPEITSLSSLRNIAMSSININDKETVIRFRFISLLSQGIVTVIFLLTITKISYILMNENFDAMLALVCIALLFLSFLLSFPFILREREFYDRARRLPIDSYIAAVENSDVRDKVTLEKVVYLAGGHHSGWQQKIINKVYGFKYKDPSSNGLKDPQQYTNWDLEAIRNCNIVFAYLEATNPSGYGLSLEIGYAAALGKLIIFINEKPSSDRISEYLAMLKESSNVNFDNLQDGIDYLKTLS